MPSILDFLAAANDSINQAAKEQAHREALAAAYLNVPASHTAVKPLAARAQQMLDQAEKAKAPTHAQAMRGALTSARGAPALANSPALAKMASVAEGAAEAIGKEIDRHEKLTDAASAYLGIMDRADPAVRRLAQGMDGLLKKQTTGAEALKKAYADATRSGLIASATLAGLYAQLHHLSGAANPGVMRAWDGALRMVSSRISNTLLPEMTSIIDTISDVADWFENLTEPAKKIVSYATVGTTALVGLGTAFGALWPAIAITKAVLSKKAIAEREEGAAALSAATSIEVASSRIAKAGRKGGMGIGGALGKAGLIALAGEMAWSAVQVFNPYESNVEDQATRDKERKSIPVTEDDIKAAFQKPGVAGSILTLGLANIGYHGSGNAANYERFQGMSQEQRAKFAEEEARRLRQKALDIHEGRTNLPERYAAELEGRAAIFDRVAAHGVASKEEVAGQQRLRHLRQQASSMMHEHQASYGGLAEARKALQTRTLNLDQYRLDELKQSRKALTAILAEIKREEQKQSAREARSRSLSQ